MNLEIFTEQAEYLSVEAFTDWSTSLYNEATIIRKLSQSGAKLITGPRGCGKTTLLLKVYNKLIQDSSSTTLPIYVNFKSSLKLEPLYKTNPNAAFWFNQWLLFKVYKGLYASVTALDGNVSDVKPFLHTVEKVIDNLELGITVFSGISNTSATELINSINNFLESLERTRCVILLDDAGHAFSSEQQHDFFEFFREIKTKTISPKAAVYPGVTSYSSSFHIGHDAEEIDVWMKPSSEGYLTFMHSLLKTRLGEDAFNQLCELPALLNSVCFAAYGIPRALLNMVSEFNAETDDREKMQFKLNSKDVLTAIKNNYTNTYSIYDTLSIKLPMYSNFVSTGVY